MTVALGLILSPIDFPLLPQWLEYHAVHFDRVIIAVDCPFEILGEKLKEYLPQFSPEKVVMGTFFYPNMIYSKLEIFSHLLNNDFATMRNSIIERNPCDWLIFLDADEELLHCGRVKEDIANAALQGCQVIAFPRVNYIDGVERKDLYPDYQFRGCSKDCRYINMAPTPGASPGCHETLDRTGGIIGFTSTLEILHTKEKYRFRHKGYSDENSTEEDEVKTNELRNRL
jgi:hypothetical protein